MSSNKFAGIRPLVIILDGVDQLLPIEEAMKAMWAICHMPSNVHIILSVVTQMGEIDLAQMISSVVTENDSVQLVEPLSQSDVRSLIDSLAMDMNKKLEDGFKEKLIESSKLFESLSNPLSIYHAIKMALSDFSKTVNMGNASDILAERLKELEEKYHPSLIKHIASYLTINPLGIQERELLDVLNSDTALISSILQEKGSLLKDSEISAFEFARIKLDLNNFLRNNTVCGKMVLAWNHRTWFETTANMYGVIYPGIDQRLIDPTGTTFTLKLHEKMTRLYTLDRDVSAPPDNIFPQPTEESSKLKLLKLPSHLHILLPVEGLNRMKTCIFFNLRWLLAKIKAFSVQEVLSDLQSAINLAKMFSDDMEMDTTENTVEDLRAMYEFLQLAEDGLRFNPDNLIPEVLARLPPILPRYPTLSTLLNDALDFVSNTTCPYLVPIYPCLRHPDSPLRHILKGPTHLIDLIQDDMLALLFSQNTGLGIVKVETGELIHRFPTSVEQFTDSILSTRSGEYVLIGHYSHLNHVMDLEVYSIATGIPIVRAQFPQKFEVMRLDPYDQILLVSTAMSISGHDEEPQRCLLGIDIRSKEIVYTIPVTANNVHNHGISDMMFLGDSLQVITVGNKMSKDLASWNLESQDLLWKINFDFHARVKTTDANKIVVVSSENGLANVINTESGEILLSESHRVIKVAGDIYVTKQCKDLVMGSSTFGLSRMDLETGTVVDLMPPSDLADNNIGKVTRITMDADEKFIFTGYTSGIIEVFSLERKEVATRLDCHDGRIVSLAYTEDFKLISTSQDGRCCVWNVRYCRGIGDDLPRYIIHAYIYSNQVETS